MGSLGSPCFMHGPAGSVHTAAVQHCHPIAPVLDPPQAALLLSSSFCKFSAWQLGAEMRSLLPMVPKQYWGVLKALNQIWINYLRGQKFCFSTEPHAMWMLFMSLHSKEGAVWLSTSALAGGKDMKKIWEKLKEHKRQMCHCTIHGNAWIQSNHQGATERRTHAFFGMLTKPAALVLLYCIFVMSVVTT